MSIEIVIGNILPILEHANLKLHPDIKDPRDRLSALFGEMEILASDSHDVIDLKRTQQILESTDLKGDLKDQAKKISNLAKVSLKGAHRTFLSREDVKKSDRGYFELLWSAADLLSNKPSVLKRPLDSLLLSIDIDSLVEVLLKNFTPKKTILQTLFSSIEIFLGFGREEGTKIQKTPRENEEFIKRALEEILLFIKYDKKPELSFLNKKDPSEVKLLFSIIDYLGVDEFQREYLEPFNKEFPKISLTDAPETVKSLKFSVDDVREIDFAKFPHLEEIDLWHVENLTPAHFKQLSSCSKLLKKIALNYCKLEGFDFSGFPNLEELDLSNTTNLTQAHLKQLSSSKLLKKIVLNNCNLEGFDFSEFPNLEELDLPFTTNLTQTHLEQLSSCSKFLKKIRLVNCDITNFNFPEFPCLAEIDLSFTRNLTQAHLEQLSSRSKVLKKLSLSLCDIVDFNFSTLPPQLEELNLPQVNNLTQAHLEQLSSHLKVLKKLSLLGCDVTDFNFSTLPPQLEEITLSFATNLTPAHFEQISPHIRKLNLILCNVADVNFSRFTQLKEIDLRNVKNLSTAQINQIRQTCPECKIIL